MNFFILFLFAINILSVLCISDCQEVQLFFEQYKLRTGSDIVIPECCIRKSGNYIDCDNLGRVTEIHLRYRNRNDKIDFSSFPVLNNVKTILIAGPIFSNNAFPSNFLTYPNLESLEIVNAELQEVPDINSSCSSLTKLSVYNNTIQGFPNTFLNCKKLNHLNLSVNEGIDTIPDDISTLKDLNYLYIGMTGLETLNPKIYELEKLIDLDISGIGDLTAEINFKKPVENCDFRNTNISCYTKGSCEKFILQEDPQRLTVPEKDKENDYKQCSETSSSRGLGSGSGSRTLIIIICVLYF